MHQKPWCAAAFFPAAPRCGRKEADNLFMKKHNKQKPLGRVGVKKKVLRVQELSDKVSFAVEQFKAAQKKFEQGRDSYREWKNIIRLLDIEIKSIQHFKAVAFHNMGVIHASRGEYVEAERMFKQAVHLDPGYGMAWYNLAVAYKKMQDEDRCMDCFKKAKELGYRAGPDKA